MAAQHDLLSWRWAEPDVLMPGFKAPHPGELTCFGLSGQPPFYHLSVQITKNGFPMIEDAFFAFSQAWRQSILMIMKKLLDLLEYH